MANICDLFVTNSSARNGLLPDLDFLLDVRLLRDDSDDAGVAPRSADHRSDLVDVVDGNRGDAEIIVVPDSGHLCRVAQVNLGREVIR